MLRSKEARIDGQHDAGAAAILVDYISESLERLPNLAGSERHLRRRRIEIQ